jgi:hypothetical protein
MTFGEHVELRVDLLPVAAFHSREEAPHVVLDLDLEVGGHRFGQFQPGVGELVQLPRDDLLGGRGRLAAGAARDQRKRCVARGGRGRGRARMPHDNRFDGRLVVPTRQEQGDGQNGRDGGGDKAPSVGAASGIGRRGGAAFVGFVHRERQEWIHPTRHRAMADLYAASRRRFDAGGRLATGASHPCGVGRSIVVGVRADRNPSPLTP